VRVTRTRANVVTLAATSQELSALVSGARMALAIVRADPDAPAEARDLGTLLARVVADYDRALDRARNGGTSCTS
jgi:hypothetical protein